MKVTIIYQKFKTSQYDILLYLCFWDLVFKGSQNDNSDSKYLTNTVQNFKYQNLPIIRIFKFNIALKFVNLNQNKKSCF